MMSIPVESRLVECEFCQGTFRRQGIAAHRLKVHRAQMDPLGFEAARGPPA